MPKKIGTVAAASIAAFAVGATVAGGITIATANNDNTSNSTATTANTSDTDGYGPMGNRGMHERGPGELVTGEEAQKAIDAALAAVPGTADHARKTADGNYLVMVTTSDGKHIVVTLDSTFVVTGQQEMTGEPGEHGPGTPATDEETQKATDAAHSRLPGATVLNVFKRPDGGFAVLARTDNGRKRVVLLDENYAVESVQNPRKHHRRDGDRGPGGRHGQRGPGKMGHDVVGTAFKKAEAAALEKVPGGTVLDVHKKGKKYLAFVRKDDGTVVVVTMNRDFQVTGTRTMDFPARSPQPTPSASAAA